MGVVVVLAPDTGRRAVGAAKRMVGRYPPCISRHVAVPGEVGDGAMSMRLLGSSIGIACSSISLYRCVFGCGKT